jgi:hypothetical protein
MFHCSQDVVFREGIRYIAPNDADEAILNKHFHSDVIVKSTPTKKSSQPSQPITTQFTEHQPELPWDNNSPPHPPQGKKK